MSKPTTTDPKPAQGGRRDAPGAALFLAGVGLFWVAATWAGGALGLPIRVRALFDLFALAGFGWALWMIYQVWRDRQDDKG